MIKIDNIIDEAIHMQVAKKLNENYFSENNFFEKKGGESESDESFSDKDLDRTRKRKKRKKSKKMASDSLMEKLKDIYQNNKNHINLRGCVSEVYGIPTDTKGSEKNLIKLNSKTRKVLAALNGEKREDNGIPFNLTKYVALRLLKTFNA